VSKASVTIVFDNKDKMQSPASMREFDQIVVTRSIQDQLSKYIINGKRIEAAKVRNMFQQVQLNIQAPHFLIMQGKVAKVCQMKP
jgi:structural maintenance of chromosome 2